MRWIIALVILLAPVSAAAKPVTLICKGTRIAPNPSTGVISGQNITFQVTIDLDARRLLRDGQAMVIRQWSDSRIIYSEHNPGILAALANDVVTTLNPASGAWRDKWGGGTCQAAEDGKRP